jgi:hypothetical protein
MSVAYGIFSVYHGDFGYFVVLFLLLAVWTELDFELANLRCDSMDYCDACFFSYLDLCSRVKITEWIVVRLDVSNE